jgi:hypothetical protein
LHVHVAGLISRGLINSVAPIVVHHLLLRVEAAAPIFLAEQTVCLMLGL